MTEEGTPMQTETPDETQNATPQKIEHSNEDLEAMIMEAIKLNEQQKSKIEEQEKKLKDQENQLKGFQDEFKKGALHSIEDAMSTLDENFKREKEPLIQEFLKDTQKVPIDHLKHFAPIFSMIAAHNRSNSNINIVARDGITKFQKKNPPPKSDRYVKQFEALKKKVKGDTSVLEKTLSSPSNLQKSFNEAFRK